MSQQAEEFCAKVAQYNRKSYLTVKVGRIGLEVALDILLDRLTGGTIAIFQLWQSVDVLETCSAIRTRKGCARPCEMSTDARDVWGAYRADGADDHVLVARMLRILLDGGGRLLGRHF
jgi:hypothetical protein